MVAIWIIDIYVEEITAEVHACTTIGTGQRRKFKTLDLIGTRIATEWLCTCPVIKERKDYSSVSFLLWVHGRGRYCHKRAL